MAVTVADTIRELTRSHIAETNGMTLGQCLTAVGWVQNTVPAQAEGNHELPMTDVAGAGIAVGAALMGRRPVFVLRFQSLLWLNVSPIVNYAAKSMEIWGVPCPVLVRAIGVEGGGTGPIHSNCNHSMVMSMPGLPVCAPMTPGEYRRIWDHWMSHDDPVLVSEHRRSYLSDRELPDMVKDGAVATIYALSAARFTAEEAVARLEAEGIRVNLVHVLWLKPFDRSPSVLAPLLASGRGLVVDCAYECASAARSIAYELMEATGKPVRALGLEERSPGASRHLENGTPSPERIAAAIRALIAV
ncbi:transketolase C-terminal domain-containing protein [Magnetospirillum sp. UT-4]|uniref:transketolase C-terminal domain-containing protein n=1 Tax=Magnetospirillum sp. UT-4 TaxID=2681467 RepID=UPI00138471D7|nr:transketolase C-terminal domain-containing protein [Magnetospirillum sp. UT-4]CAA7618431.1 putative Transketolase, central region [Magnetospirillum sp. UT-4]